jgi:uncharacterized protein
MPTIDIYAELGPQPFPTRATTVPALEELMNRFGVDQTFVAATEALRDSMSAGNAWLQGQIQGHPRFRGLCVVNPVMLEPSQLEMRKYLSQECFVGAILHEGYVNRPLNSEAMRQLVKSLLRYDKPLLLQVNDPRAINDLQETALEYPTQRFVILHMAGEYWPMALTLAQKAVNISLETGGMVADFDKLAEAVQVVGAHRLVFGSGMPSVNPVYALGMIRDSAIPAQEKERILARNAKKLFTLA